MKVIAVIGSVAFSRHIVESFLIAKICLYVWASCWAPVFVLASVFSLTDSIRNITRFPLRGCGRARFWFEIARSTCILGALLALVFLCFLLNGRSDGVIAGKLFNLIATCFVAFCATSTVGYLCWFVKQQPVSGRAVECVSFFYPICAAGFAVLAFVFMTERHFDSPVRALITLAAICLFGALALSHAGKRHASHQWRRD